jgi:hypothetical protein
MPDPIKPEDIVLAKDFAKQYPHLFPHKTSLAHQLRQRESNGLSDASAVLMINGQVYLSVSRYMAAVASKVA